MSRLLPSSERSPRPRKWSLAGLASDDDLLPLSEETLASPDRLVAALRSFLTPGCAAACA